jgi:hypothetical protein
MPGEIPVARALFKLEDRLVSLDALVGDAVRLTVTVHLPVNL